MIGRGSTPATRLWLAALAASAMLSTACRQTPRPDAYGNVEAVETVVSAQVGGQLTSLSVEEGQMLTVGTVVGAIDATSFTLERHQVNAQRAVSVARRGEIAQQRAVLESQREATLQQRHAAEAQLAALEVQLDVAKRAYDRTQRLFSQQAATSQQIDQAEREYRVLERQIQAQHSQIDAYTRQADAQARQHSTLEAQRVTLDRQVQAVEAQGAQVDDRIGKAQITNPARGTVLVLYARPGEVVQPGQPLYKIASLDVVDVRAYVTQPQLASVRIGQTARVSMDVGENLQQLEGTVSWVASQAEFTPTPIQTREERADLVYAVKLRVPNPQDQLKIGMPVDVEFVP